MYFTNRAGSTGTTGDESYTTDEDDIPDEPDCAIRDVKDLKEHVTNGVYGEFTRDGSSSPEMGEEHKSSGRIPEIAVHGDADLELRAKPVLQHHQVSNQQQQQLLYAFTHVTQRNGH